MNYFAITIGPIYKTFQNVRKTRELWAASYIFSLISKLLIEEINRKENGAIYIPYSSPVPKGIGIYPDRIFLKSVVISISDIESIKTKVYGNISQILDQTDGNSNSIQFIKDYFRIYTVQYNILENENPLLIGNHLLNTAELRTLWQTYEQPNQLLNFFRQINKLRINDHKWINEHLDEQDIFNENRFESLIEIATRPIRHFNTNVYRNLVKKYCYKDTGEEIDGNEDPFVADLKTALNHQAGIEIFKNYHKYICIVKADGDMVGRYIKSINENIQSELTNISQKLYKWGIATAGLIKEYKGVPIYIGGDDVLFIAPVVGANNQHIIELCKNINENFKGQFTETRTDSKGPIKPTLSFGVSITYYKFPLNEAVQKADELLKLAKNTRNTLCISHLKHSGNSMDINLPLDANNNITRYFMELYPYFQDNANFVSSLIHHLRDHETVYRVLKGNAELIKNYLLNNFDASNITDMVIATSNLIVAVINKHEAIDGDRKKSIKAMEEVFSMLRILKFLNGHDDGK